MSAPPGIFKAYDIRGIYGDEIDGDLAEEIGRAFTRVIGELSGKDTADLGIGLGHDMRLPAAELSERYRQGIMAEGAHVIDIGEVGTEMLYWLVGSRELDGGLMCTASHNPKAYTGAKLVKDGAIALSGDSGIQEIRTLIGDGLGPAPGGGTSESKKIYNPFGAAALEFIDPGAVKPLKVVVDGGNGMAGPMVGPILRYLKLDLDENYFVPDGNFPGHEPNPLLPENRQFIIDWRPGDRRGPRYRLGRGRRSVLLHRRHGSFRRRRLSHRPACREPSREGSRIPDPLRRARFPGGKGHRRASRWNGASQPCRSRLLQDPHA